LKGRHVALPPPSAALRRVLVTLALTLAIASGCMGGGDSAALDKSELKGLVLQPRDLPRAFVRFDEGRQTRTDQPDGTLADVERFGRQDGWKARYRRSGSPSTTGPLVIESRADVFENTGGAEKEFEGERGQILEGLRLEQGAPALGDESYVAAGSQGSGRFKVRFYLVGWRHENVTASVLANGFAGKLTRDEVVGLARKQQARLEAAG
jgi:hypothetical protein